MPLAYIPGNAKSMLKSHILSIILASFWRQPKHKITEKCYPASNMKKTMKSLIKNYGIVSAFIFLMGFLFPPMIFLSNPAVYPMRAVYSGLFTVVAAWILLIAGRVIRHNMCKVEPEHLPEKKSPFLPGTKE